jgi:hypothetical protein
MTSETWELLGETEEVAVVRFTGRVGGETLGYDVRSSFTESAACQKFVQAVHAAKGMSCINLSRQPFEFPDLPERANYYDTNLCALVQSTPKGGTLTVPAQLHAHWRQRVNAIPNLADKMSGPTLFAVDVASVDELYDSNVPVYLHKLSTTSPCAIVFVQEKAGFEVTNDEGAPRFVQCEAHTTGTLLGLFETTPDLANVFVIATPAAPKDRLPLFLHAMFGAHKCAESHRTKIFEESCVIPPHMTPTKELMPYLDANAAVVNGAQGVQWSQQASVFKFKVSAAGLAEAWTVTAMLAKTHTKTTNERAGADTPAQLLVTQMIELVRTNFRDKTALHDLMQTDHRDVFAQFPDLARVCAQVVSKGCKCWSSAVNAFESAAYAATRPPFPPAHVASLAPTRQMSEVPWH